MGLTYIANASATNNAGGTTLDCSSALNIVAKDVLIGIAGWETTDTATAIADTAATNSMTMFARAKSAGTNLIQIGYRLVAQENATAIFRASFGGTAGYRNIIVFQFRPDASDTISLDAGPSSGTGNGTAAVTGNINTTETDEVVVYGVKTYAAATYANQLIAEGAVDLAVNVSTYFGAAYKLFASTQSAIHGQCDWSGTVEWVADIIAIKSVAPAGGVIPVIMNHYRRLRT
jgi:hypothetical protein